MSGFIKTEHLLEKYKLYFIFILYYIFSFVNAQNIQAQSSPDNLIYNNKFEILRSQLNIYKSYISFSLNQNSLLAEADSLGAIGEYEIGIIYLEEILHSIKISKEPEKEEVYDTQFKIRDLKNSNFKNLSLVLSTGIDFDRHEFEYNYNSSDSTILEEFTKPFTSMELDYILFSSKESSFNINNSIRYDNQNLRDDYYLNYKNKNLNIKFGGYLNKSYNSTYSSYWENNFRIAFSENILDNVKIFFQDYYNYKLFSESDLNYTDYYRNFLELNLEYQFTNYEILALYKNELNEYLGNENNDYKQNSIGIGYKKTTYRNFVHSAILEYELRDYETLFGDSTLSNKYNQISLLIDWDYRLVDNLAFGLENHFIKKRYHFQSTFEPDYYWNYLRPLIEFNFLSTLQLGFGYEWELKIHSLIEENGTSSTEQDYNSNGVYSSISYFTLEGITLLFTASYQWRKYPDSPTNDLINLYSSRNILSLIATGNIPINKNLGINILAVYDNDKDVDNDQGNTQSSIYNIELEYRF